MMLGAFLFFLRTLCYYSYRNASTGLEHVIRLRCIARVVAAIPSIINPVEITDCISIPEYCFQMLSSIIDNKNIPRKVAMDREIMNNKTKSFIKIFEICINDPPKIFRMANSFVRFSMFSEIRAKSPMVIMIIEIMEIYRDTVAAESATRISLARISSSNNPRNIKSGKQLCHFCSR